MMKVSVVTAFLNMAAERDDALYRASEIEAW